MFNLKFLNRKQDLESQDRSANEDSGDMSEEEEEEEVGGDSKSIFCFKMDAFIVVAKSPTSTLLFN